MIEDIIAECEKRLDTLERELHENLLGSHYEEAERISREISELKELISQQERELYRLRGVQVDELPVRFSRTEKLGVAADTDSEKLDQIQKRVEERNAEIQRLKILMSMMSTEQAVTEDKKEEPPKDGGVIYSERLTFSESYVLLSKIQKGYCDSLRDYAIQQSGLKEYPAKYHLSVGNGQKVVLKLTIKNGVVYALFRLEDERLRRIGRSASLEGAEIKIKETELPVSDDAAYQTAQEMINLRVVQLQEDIASQKQRAAERRKMLRESNKKS